MSKNLEKLVEEYFYKTENLINVDKLNELITEVYLLNEKNWDFKKLAKRPDYIESWIQRIQNGEPFTVITPNQEEPLVITIKKEFAEKLRKASKAGEGAMEKLFGSGKNYLPSIPADNGEFYTLQMISKDTFTTKKTTGGLGDTNMPIVKEGLVCYFYNNPDVMNIVEQKILGEIKSNSAISLKPPLEYGIADNAQLIGKDNIRLKNAIAFLNNNKISSDDEKKLYMNAISAARTILQFAPGKIIDRGDLFEKIRDAGTKITGLRKDKWCPGDVYLYDEGSQAAILEIIKESLQEKTIVDIKDFEGNVVNVGLNSLFDQQESLVIAVSLKEERAQHGRATEFANMTNVQGKNLSEYETPERDRLILELISDIRIARDKSKKIKDSKYNYEADFNKKITAISNKLKKQEPELDDEGLTDTVSELQEAKKTVTKTSAKSNKSSKTPPIVFELIDEYVTAYSEEKKKLFSILQSQKYSVPSIKDAQSERLKGLEDMDRLYYLVSKKSCYEFFNDFLTKFDTLKQINPQMSKYLNPLLALTAYGVSLNGFNPTFYKVNGLANGKPSPQSKFDGRDSLQMSSKEVTLFDSVDKAGFLFQFDTLMGKGEYQTRLDIRFAGGVKVNIIVEKFKETKKAT